MEFNNWKVVGIDFIRELIYTRGNLKHHTVTYSFTVCFWVMPSGSIKNDQYYYLLNHLIIQFYYYFHYWLFIFPYFWLYFLPLLISLFLLKISCHPYFVFSCFISSISSTYSFCQSKRNTFCRVWTMGRPLWFSNFLI